jgi:hypothetical protein
MMQKHNKAHRVQATAGNKTIKNVQVDGSSATII